MISKTFEIRDRATFIPVLAVQLDPGCESDRYLLARSGYGRLPPDQAKYVMLMRLAGGKGEATADPFDWGGRTMPTAHQFIIDNFHLLLSGCVVDVRLILGEAPEAEQSEQFTEGNEL